MDKKFVYDKLASLNLSNLQKNEIYNLVNEVSKNSGGNNGNTAEPNIIYETDILIYGYSAFQPKYEEGENLIKTDNLENTFVKLNLMLAEDIKFNTILIPVQYSVFPLFEGGQSTNIDMFTGKYDESYFLETSFRLGINVSIASMGGLNLVYISPLKVNDVEIYINDNVDLGGGSHVFDTPLMVNLKMNQFSEIYLRWSDDSRLVVRLNNVMWEGEENNYVTIIGSYIDGDYLCKVRLNIPSAGSASINIKTYQLTPTT